MVMAKNYGRMGNVLFQVATAIGYALKNNIEFSVQNTSTSNFWNPIYLQHLVNQNWVQDRQDILIREQCMPYQELPFKEEWRNKQIVLDGYFQSEKYFKDYRNEILELFAYPYQFMENYVSVHVRRGDYLELTMKHPPVTIEWYEKAMSMFKNCTFKFFSDDIKWCKETFGHRGDCEFSEGKTIEQDLIEASWCANNICSSSTFGWWQMWLNKNPNKIAIFPENWFVPGWDNSDTSDILPEWVTKI